MYKNKQTYYVEDLVTPWCKECYSYKQTPHAMDFNHFCYFFYNS